MSRVFVSHSRWNNRQAKAVKAWLIQHEPGLVDDIYLDVDPLTGIRPGVRWKQALQQANSRCEAVICLLSQHWLDSAECQTEFRYSETLNKSILVGRLEPLPDTNITSEWQRCDLFADDGSVVHVDIGDGGPVELAGDGLKRLLAGLRALGIGAEYFPWPPPNDVERAPYRGWAPLEEADAAVFFGRDAQILRGLDLLHGMRISGVEQMFVVLGPSGAGKSSFLRAGLMPRLRRDDRRFLPLPMVRPERAVLSGEIGLARSIHGLRTELGLRHPVLGEIKSACRSQDVDRLRDWLQESRDAAGSRSLAEPAGQPGPTLVLPVDQAEELFNVDAGPEAARFLELMAALTGSKAGFTPMMILALTIRADRYEPLQVAPQLTAVRSIVFDDLKPMPAAGYAEVITGPARRATAAGRRLTVEPALLERLLAETADGADALPLLALTLERLHGDYGADGDLTLAEFEAMGGMEMVVQNAVVTTLDSDPAERRAQLNTLHDAFIPWLATINPLNNEPMRRLARWEDLPVASLPLIQSMVDKRLLVKDARGGDVVVEVALESLLRQWRELAAWLRDEAQDLKNADSLERAAADWQGSGQDRYWLPQGTRLVEAETLAAKPHFRSRLATIRDFLQSARTRENERTDAEKERQQAELHAAKQHAAALRKRSRILAAVSVVTAVVAVVAVFLGVEGYSLRREANERLREAVSIRLDTETPLMLTGYRPGGPVRAYQQLVTARQLLSSPDDGPLLDVLPNLVKIIGTPAAVGSVAMSHDGQRIVAGGSDQVIRVWDANTGELEWESPPAYTNALNSVTFSPDGTRIASAGDRSVRLWDAGTGQPIGSSMLHSDFVLCVAFSPDGTRIASGGRDDVVRLWNAETGAAVGELTGHTSDVDSVAFSPDGKRIVSGSDDKTLRLWNTDTGHAIGDPLVGHESAVTSVAFSPDGRRVVSGSWDKTVRLWDVSTLKPLGKPMAGPADYVSSVAFSPDGRRVAAGSWDKTVRLWNADNGQPIGLPLTGQATDPLKGVTGIGFSPDGNHLLSGSFDTTIRIWDVDTARPFGQSLMPDGTGVTSNNAQRGVADVAFSPDGERIASASFDGAVRVWSANTGKQIGPPLIGHTDAVTSVAFSPDGKRLASSSGDGTVRFWDVVAGRQIGAPLTGHSGAVYTVAFSPDGQRVVSGGGDGTVRFWDVNTHTQIGTALAGSTSSVNAVAFSPDGERVVTGAGDGVVRLWDAHTRKAIGEPLSDAPDWIHSVAFSPDGTRIVAGSSSNMVRLWDANTGKLIGEPLVGHTGYVFGVAFSPDGKRIASSGNDNTIRLWNAENGRPLGAPLSGHVEPAYGLAFSPDGSTLVSGSIDGSLRLWPMFAEPLAALCSKLTTNMSHKQWRDWVSPDIGYEKACPDLPIAAD